MLKKLIFKDKVFDAVIILNGDTPDSEIFMHLKSIPLLAADGASNSMLEQNIEPDFIIGDLDSVSVQLKNDSKWQDKLIFNPDQETNDFEKALVFAQSCNYQNILILGFHGGALEHTLNNWSVLSRFSKRMNLCVYESGRYSFCTDFSFSFNPDFNEMVSLVPIVRTKLTTTNLKWELNDEILAPGIREGTRNVALSNDITIQIHSGELLVFVDSRFPICPEWNY